VAIVSAAVLVAGLYRRYPIPMVIVTLALIVAGVMAISWPLDAGPVHLEVPNHMQHNLTPG